MNAKMRAKADQAVRNCKVLPVNPDEVLQVATHVTSFVTLQENLMDWRADSNLNYKKVVQRIVRAGQINAHKRVSLFALTDYLPDNFLYS